ncbi:aspartyl/asparaginyl beta-hydroxylase isoform X3 [Monodelphis domestica]|uniref:aspartyl/asparaginyl beta-hydroxylase isoform X3 n=1 Tax=Monodelphis domestica TaxID=13616 RepID=UPI0024E226F7|nr:aspartyl/asparaginyl beta-hydroxylase isoform X3 [Monodelphis domestica]XP_056679946.1 aspartyl/asparaginyl beta-hydroxylase isoform X3 [Monodelphis domestica]
MAQRKNAKGGGGHSSSSPGSSSSSAGGSSSSSSPGSRREAKHGGHKNGKKEGLSGSSFFTWFMVIALLGVWTSVAVVWFDLVDYEEVLGKLGIYDADGDGDFDVDDAKALLGLKEKSATAKSVFPGQPEDHIQSEDHTARKSEHQDAENEVEEHVPFTLEEALPTQHENDKEEEEVEAVGDQQVEDEDIPIRDELIDKLEELETEILYEETEDRYQIEDLESDSNDYNKDVEEIVYEQENPDYQESVVEDTALEYDTEDTPNQDYDEQVYEPPENEKTEVASDIAIEELNMGIEEGTISPIEEPHEIPTEAAMKTNDPEQKEKAKKKKPKLLNKFDKTIKSELDAAEKLRKKGKIEDAMNAFEELVRKYPQSPRARYGKAQCEDDLAEKRRSNEVLKRAIETYQEVADLPNVPADLVKLSLKRQSERQQFLGHMRGSLVTLQKLVHLFPNETSFKNDLGVGYLLIGDNDNAKKVYEEVLNVTPNDGFAKVHYGFILKAQNKIAESIPYLKEGLESGDPGTDDGRFYFHLGDALQRVGNKEAYKWYELGHKRGHFASVWQRSLYNVNGLKAQPWWTAKETGYTELVKILEKNWKLIRDEGLAVLDKTQGLFLPEDENLREKGDWSQFTLWQQGRKNENSCRGAPKTCALLEKFPETTGCRRGQIKYSVMHPGTHVWPHTGPTNCRLRMHLGLVIPKEGCKIRCAQETKFWEEGKVLIFDDSFEHEVWQDASSLRLIFIVDVWHPELTPQQRRSLPAI